MTRTVCHPRNLELLESAGFNSNCHEKHRVVPTLRKEAFPEHLQISKMEIFTSFLTSFSC